jgi:hypothetical protein
MKSNYLLANKLIDKLGKTSSKDKCIINSDDWLSFVNTIMCSKFSHCLRIETHRLALIQGIVGYFGGVAIKTDSNVPSLVKKYSICG